MDFIKQLLQEYNDNTRFEDHANSQFTQNLVAYVKRYLQGHTDLRTIAEAAYKVMTTLPTAQDSITKQYKSNDIFGASQTTEYKKANEQYKQNIEATINYITKSKKWDKFNTSNTGAWAHFVKEGNKPQSEKTFKWYGTIKDRSPDAIKLIAHILYDMDKLDFIYQVQLKVPGSYMSYLSHPDSIVIHFRGPEDKDKIAQIVQKYKKYFGDREKLGRLDYGVDDKSFRMDGEDRGDDNSDSMIVAKKFAQTVDRNREALKKIFDRENEKELATRLLSILLKISKESSHRH